MSLRGLLRIAFWAMLIPATAWTAAAFWVQIAPPLLWLVWGALAGAALLVGCLRWLNPGLAWFGFLLAAAAVALWYQSIRPSQNRDWAEEVSRGVTARIEGDRVALSNIRDFDWISGTEAEPRWIDESFDLRDLDSVDMITSVWSSPLIAHLLVSFGFSDGRHVVFSAEIRRESDEDFNEIGGFFRQFELVLIAATERDIVRLRVEPRGEEVSLYPVALTASERREMFLAYLALAQSLEARPRFYNTITSNCTTAIWRLAHGLWPGLPIGPALILTGDLPDYLARIGVLGGEGSLAERKARARIDPEAVMAAEARGLSFSQAIRDGRD